MRDEQTPQDVCGEATILDKIDGKPRSPFPPKSRMGKWRVFAFRAASSLIWRDGGLPFHFILFKIVAFAVRYLVFVVKLGFAVRSLVLP